jgi:hypothetical protein
LAWFLFTENKKRYAIDKVVQVFRKEQNNTEAFIVQIKTGTEIIRKAQSIEKDQKKFQLVSNYNLNSMGEFITNISLIMSVKNKKIFWFTLLKIKSVLYTFKRN